MTDHKKPATGFWITVALVVVLVGYPLSFGPTVWLFEHSAVPKLAVLPIIEFYRPLEWAAGNSPKPIQSLFIGYVGLWSRKR